MMINIPTELLRTLVSVVDLRSFTKAAQALGITQPAVSAQIKRLQMLLGSDIFDKSAPGVSLTPLGEMVLNHARRLLSINDHILGLADPRPQSQTIRIGVPGDFVSPHLPWTLAEFRTQWPEVKFAVRTGKSEVMLNEMRQGDIDLVIGLSMVPRPHARHQWSEESVWIRGPHIPFDNNDRIPLVSYGEECVFHRVAVEALQTCGRVHDTVYISSSTTGLASAISAGLGVMAHARSRTATQGLMIWEDGPLPKLPDVFCGIHIREEGERMLLEHLADAIRETLNAQPHLGHADQIPPKAASSF